MSIKGMKRLSNVLAGIGLSGFLLTAMACGELNDLKTTVIFGIIGVAVMAGGFIGSQLLSNEAEYREYKQRKCVTYGRND